MTRMFRVVALVILMTAASTARADVPIVARAGLGMSTSIDDRPLYCYPVHDSEFNGVLDLDAAYRVIDQLAVGAHFGTRFYAWEDCATDSLGTQMYRGEKMALELGVAANWSKDRFWLSGWLGVEDVPEEDDARPLAFSLGGGVDLYAHPSGHRVALYLDFTSADTIHDAHHHVSAGIAYRYW